MQVAHAHEGWLMELDMRRNIGYGSVVVRLADPLFPWAWLTRLGGLAVPLLVAGRAVDGLRDATRCSARYGVRWYELPLAWLAAALLPLLEVPGMLSALRGRGSRASSYR